MALSFSEAKKIPITDYLSSLGFEPAKIRGSDYWYQSPFRNERNPSFKVNTKLNVWYDHGEGQGGTILDLGVKLHQCTLPEFLQKLSGNNFHFNTLSFQQDAGKEPENKLQILTVHDLTSPELIDYINS